MRKVQEEGFGRYVDRNEMQKDKVLPSNTCFSAFVKKDMLDLPEKFFSLANNPECNQEMYVNNYDRPMELPLKKVTAIYHTEKDRLLLSVESNMSESKSFMWFLVWFFLVYQKSIRRKYTTTDGL